MATRVATVTVKLREMIITRELAPGSRVPERDLAELLGVSRTPVRLALGMLEAEGLVSGEPNCGFIVRPFSVEDVLSAYDVRGVLEGLAARAAVERGIGSDALNCLEGCVKESAALVESGKMGAEEMQRWSAANGLFHQTLLEAASLPALIKTHGFISRMPMAAPIAIMFTNNNRDLAKAHMASAHADHFYVLDAIKRGEGSRAEYLMREHAQRARDNLRLELRRKPSEVADHEVKTTKRQRQRSTRSSSATHR
jgi:GntR family transcriptional regulator, vanillate catabolism transcriptional regulator